MGQRYGQRPSSFIGLKADSWEAYQLDVAVLTVGRWVDGKLAETTKDGKPVHRLVELLSDKPEKAQGSDGFRSVAGLVTQKVKIGPSGVW